MRTPVWVAPGHQRRVRFVVKVVEGATAPTRRMQSDRDKLYVDGTAPARGRACALVIMGSPHILGTHIEVYDELCSQLGPMLPELDDEL